MNLLRTEIISADGNKTVISDEAKSFNLLELTSNNPVVLAHTSVSSGTYTQIRLILDKNSSITFKDGRTEPLKVPSGEQTGIKIDGVFDLPEGQFYTLDIDLIPGESVHYTEGNGYMMKPVIELTGSHINSGNFYYASNSGVDQFVIELNENATMRSKTSSKPGYYLKGTYNYDSANQKFTLSPSSIECPSCSRAKKYYIRHHVDVPGPVTYNINSFGEDFVELQTDSGSTLRLNKVDSFTLSNPPLTKDLTFKIQNLNSEWLGMTLYAQLVPFDYIGGIFSSATTIEDISNTTVTIDIQRDPNRLTTEYILLIGVIDNTDTFSVDSASNVISFDYNALVAKNNVVAENINID